MRRRRNNLRGGQAIPVSVLPTTVIAGRMGSTNYGIGEEGVIATSTTFNMPSSASFDSSGNMYICDTYNHAIRMINAKTGIVLTIAGDGTPGFSGDGGDPRLAQLNFPSSIAIDPDGLIYISDSNNNRIRLIDPYTVSMNGSLGKISTIAGIDFPVIGVDPELLAADKIAHNAARRDLTDLMIGNLDQKVADAKSTATAQEKAQELFLSGEGGPAISATLFMLNDICLDPKNNILYILDGNYIRKITLDDGIISTVAGGAAIPPGSTAIFQPKPQGTNIYRQDVGLAIESKLFSPTSIDIDYVNKLLYVAQRGSGNVGACVYCITLDNGMMSIIAGGGNIPSNTTVNSMSAIISPISITCTSHLYTGIKNNFVYISDELTGSILKLTADNGSTTLANVSGGQVFNNPYLELDNGEMLYILDSGNNCIWYSNTEGVQNNKLPDLVNAIISKQQLSNVITTFAGTPKADIFAAEVYLDPTKSKVGWETLWNPTSIAVDMEGNLLVTDRNYIKKVMPDPNGGMMVGIIAGNLGWEVDYFDDKWNIIDGSKYTIDTSGNAIDDKGKIVPNVKGYNVLFQESCNKKVYANVDEYLKDMKQLDTIQYANAGLTLPTSEEQKLIDANRTIDFNNKRNNINTSVRLTDNSCQKGISPIKTCLQNPTGLAVDTNNNVYFADIGWKRVKKISPNTTGKIDTLLTCVAGVGNGTDESHSNPSNPPMASDTDQTPTDSLNTMLYNVRSVAVDTKVQTNLFVINGNDIHYINYAGRGSQLSSIVTSVGVAGFFGDGHPASGAKLNKPSKIVVDNSGNLLIADTENHRIRKITRISNNSFGDITTIAGNGSAFGDIGDGKIATEASLSKPRGIAIDNSGAIYIADTGHNRIRYIDPSNSIIYTIAGNGAGGSFGAAYKGIVDSPYYNGEGMTATDCTLNAPYDVDVDMSGNVYIADTGNNIIRKFHLDKLPTISSSSIIKDNIPKTTAVESLADSSADQTARAILTGVTEIPGEYLNNVDDPNAPLTYLDADGKDRVIVTNGDITAALGMVDTTNMKNINSLNDVDSLKEMLDTVDTTIQQLYNSGYVWQNISADQAYLYPYRLQLINKIATLSQGGGRRKIRRSRKSKVRARLTKSRK